MNKHTLMIVTFSEVVVSRFRTVGQSISGKTICSPENLTLFETILIYATKSKAVQQLLWVLWTQSK